MARHDWNTANNSAGLAVLILILIVSATAYAQEQHALPSVGEGSLVYHPKNADGYACVPLQHTDVALDVRVPVASATVTQQFINKSATPIEAVYIFPLPHDAAVYDMEIRIGNRIIRSTIRERAEARRVYEAAKSEGKRAALLEQERPNIFTASVANIMPGDRIAIRMRYVEPLRWDGGTLRLVYPMVVGPRYIPGTQSAGQSGTGWAADTDAVPDASRITPPVRNPQSRSGHDLSLMVDLDAGFNAKSLQSVSHAIKTSRLRDGRQRIELEQGATIPNKDFILQINQEQSRQPKTALFLSPGDSGETHFLLTVFPPAAAPPEHVAVEMLYMIDVSGSMAGASVEQARSALLQALNRLQPSDRFSILAFNDRFQEFSPNILSATAENVEQARRFVMNLQAEGGTEMLPALVHLMQKPAGSKKLRHIVLLTDGDLGNEEEILTAQQARLGAARLHTVAIGSAPNLYLATKMAQLGRGSFTHISDDSEIGERMTQLFAKLENPVLTDIRLSFEGIEVADVYPKSFPDLFLDEPLLIYGRITAGQAGRVHFKAGAGSRPYDDTISINTKAASFHPGITTLWARQRVEDLMDLWRKAEGEEDRIKVRSDIVEQAIRYRLVTRFTSLVAVEEIVVNPGGHSNMVPVPTELPAGWQMDKVFGAPATGTADEFFKTLGLALLLAGLGFWHTSRRRGKRI